MVETRLNYIRLKLYHHGSTHTWGRFIGHTDPVFIKTEKETICRFIDSVISSFNVICHNNNGSPMMFVSTFYYPL